MQIKLFFFSTILATLATGIPTELDHVETNTLSTRDTQIGAVFWNYDRVGLMYVNGGCVSFSGLANHVVYRTGTRCRFFR
jgi:hypothetical protein